jgi:uncharacterized protein with GYD domain
MPTYVTLANFTDQGMKNIKDTTKRAEAFRKAGITVKEILWTQGQYDLVTIVEGSDDTANVGDVAECRQTGQYHGADAPRLHRSRYGQDSGKGYLARSGLIARSLAGVGDLWP